VSRIIRLGEILVERGHELFFFSGGDAYQLLKRRFENVYPCTPIVWYENSYGVMASASILNILFPLPQYSYKTAGLKLKTPSSLETVRRYYDLRKHIRRVKPDLIVADGDILALRLARRWEIPSVYVTNIIRPSFSFPTFLTPGERFTEVYVKKCTKIIVPDNPKRTICEYNLGNIEKIGINDKTEFAGSFFDMTPQKGLEKHIFAPISGPWGTRAKLARILIPILSRLETPSIVSLGNPNSKSVTKLGNCQIYGWLTEKQRSQFMKDAKMVIFSGSHGTCFEVIKNRKPSICMPTQPEQMANSKKMQELKCSIHVENLKKLKWAIAEIGENIEVYKHHVEEMSEYSRKFNGLKRATEVIETIET
jgi:UDP:flavonoid glycosyltransferase YjiC (YdhE family)